MCIHSFLGCSKEEGLASFITIEKAHSVWIGGVGTHHWQFLKNPLKILYWCILPSKLGNNIPSQTTRASPWQCRQDSNWIPMTTRSDASYRSVLINMRRALPFELPLPTTHFNTVIQAKVQCRRYSFSIISFFLQETSIWAMVCWFVQSQPESQCARSGSGIESSWISCAPVEQVPCNQKPDSDWRRTYKLNCAGY